MQHTIWICVQLIQMILVRCNKHGIWNEKQSKIGYPILISIDLMTTNNEFIYLLFTITVILNTDAKYVPTQNCTEEKKIYQKY